MKAGNLVYLVNFVQFPCFWIRVRVPNAPHPDPKARLKIKKLVQPCSFFKSRLSLGKRTTENASEHEKKLKKVSHSATIPYLKLKQIFLA